MYLGSEVPVVFGGCDVKCIHVERVYGLLSHQQQLQVRLKKKKLKKLVMYECSLQEKEDEDTRVLQFCVLAIGGGIFRKLYIKM